MKKLFFLFVCILSFQAVHGQKSVDRFIDKMKKHKNAYVVTLPGWLLRTGIEIADEDELLYEPGFQEIVDGIKKLRVLFINKDSKLDNKELRSVINQIKEKDGYVDYATIKDGRNNVHVIVKEDKTRVKSLVVLASSEDGLTILNLKTDIDMEKLKAANLSFNKNL
ncbi:MAG: hypothetical protein ACI86M_002028 [Saprospiraceae bacterium]|jgi:hypothetical protein